MHAAVAALASAGFQYLVVLTMHMIHHLSIPINVKGRMFGLGQASLYNSAPSGARF